MSRFLFIAALALFLIPTGASAFISCTTFGGVINCDDYSLPDVKPSVPIKVPDNTSGLDALKAQYGTSDVYACMSDTDYLTHSGGPSLGVYFQLLKVCVERKASYGGDIQLQKVQTAPTCPAGTYAQNGVCIQTVIQQAPAPEPVQNSSASCQDDFGPYSVWSGEWNENGGLVCDCAQGYDWQGDVCAPVVQQTVYATEPASCTAGTTYDGTSCVSHEQRCKDYYGSNSVWSEQVDDGVPVCGCREGFEWNEAQTTCRVIIQAAAPVMEATPEEPKSRGWFELLLDWLLPW